MLHIAYSILYFRFVSAFRLLIAIRSHSLINLFGSVFCSFFSFGLSITHFSSLNFSDIHKYLINFSF